MRRCVSVEWRRFSITKLGNREQENEDLIRPMDANRVYVRKKAFRCCVADGASQSAFSALWARLLTDEVQRRPLSVEQLNLAAAKASRRWASEIGTRELPWNLEWKVREGAYATLLCLELRGQTIDSGDEQEWHALAVGDTCVFQFRADELIASFPIQKSSKFSGPPNLVASIEQHNEAIWSGVSHFSGTWCDCDQFVVMTDAIAHWCLYEHELQRAPLRQLHDNLLGAGKQKAQFEKWVSQLRADRRIRNDDTSMAWFQVKIK